jgi:signal transduction histidine kinase
MAESVGSVRAVDRVLETAKRLPTTPLFSDVLIAGSLTALAVIGVLARLHVDLPEGVGEGAPRRLDGLGIGLILLQTVPLVWRRKAPVLVLSLATTGLFLLSLLGYFRSLAALGFLVALFSVAAHRDRVASIPAGLIAALAVLVILVWGKEPVDLDALIAEVLIVGGVWFVGDGLRIRRSQLVLLRERAAQLERDREERAQRAVEEERRVIARELHDVVAHNVSVIVAQAAAAQRVFPTQPNGALLALDAIETTGREALVEMRRLTGVLRTEAEPMASRSPQPGLGDLDVLADQVREAGIPTTVRIKGRPRSLPPGLDLSAFRIVQEALTNTLKHAGPAQAEVLVRYGGSRLELRITDDGSGGDGESAHSIRPKYGHLGMRERVALFGGELRVGPRPAGGYQVVASLPLDGEPL